MNSVARWRGSNPRSRFTEAPTYIHMYIQGSGTPSTAGHLWELPWSSRVREPIARIQILGPPVSSRELWVPLRAKQKNSTRGRNRRHFGGYFCGHGFRYELLGARAGPGNLVQPPAAAILVPPGVQQCIQARVGSMERLLQCQKSIVSANRAAAVALRDLREVPPPTPSR